MENYYDRLLDSRKSLLWIVLLLVWQIIKVVGVAYFLFLMIFN